MKRKRRKIIHQIHHPISKYETSEEPHGEPASRVSARVRFPNAPEYNGSATDAEENLRQWWETMREGVAILISITALCVSFGSCYNSNRSANTAESVFRITQSNERPWISVGLQLPQPVVFDKEGNLGLAIDMDVKDVGRAVAVEVMEWAEMVFLDPDGDDVAARERQMQQCDADRLPPMPPPIDAIPGRVLFPGVEATHLSVRVGKWANDITREIARALPVNKGKVGFAIIGCVSYRAASEDLMFWRHHPPFKHQTRFLYHLVQWGDDGKPAYFIKPQGSPKNIVLGRMPYGNAAD